jgi:hypothetical protein
MRVWVLLLLALAARAALKCHYLCDDPVWEPDCKPACSEPVCTFNPPCSFHSVQTEVACDEYTAEDVETVCPRCEVLAPEELQPDICSGSVILCEPIECGWSCELPEDSPKIDCRPQCERPACEAASVASRVSLFFQ